MAQLPSEVVERIQDRAAHETRQSERYKTYMRSPEWAQLRDAMLAVAEGQCEGQDLAEDGETWERCSEREGLQVHHLTYERLGRELEDDLEVLCQRHHDEADQARERRVARRQWRARVEGWARKRYGNDILFMDWDRVEMEFQDWLTEREFDD